MAVSLWAVLGIVLLVIGLPLVLVPDGNVGPGVSYAVGAGVAFEIVAVSQWLVTRSAAPAVPEPDAPDL